MKSKVITRTVWVLSFVSLFTDTASEMLYPVMPLYLQHIGFTIVGIGLLEGMAEAVAGLSKGYFGKWSDSSGKRLPFVQIGYSLSALSKPMMALFTSWWWIFGARSVDRLGKGIRTGARDALLSDEATPEKKGTVFGFHRSMDTLGAAIGPAVALAFLYFYPGQYINLFYFAFVPGLLAIAASFLIKEHKKQSVPLRKPFSFFVFVDYWKQSRAEFKRLVAALLLFALINSSDVFLLLKMKSAGMSDTMLIGIYIFYNLVYALLAYPAGILADRIGLKSTFVVGLVVFALAYGIMAFAAGMPVFIIVFLLYSLYAASTEGIAKAWISNIVDKTETATAIGTYTGFQSISALLASTLAGLLWFNVGPMAVFLVAATVTILIALFVQTQIANPTFTTSKT